MAIKDTSRKPYLVDNDSNIKVGIDLPIRRSDDKDGWFASTKTTIDAVKNNIRNLLSTNKGERFMQPNIGLNLKKYMFESFNADLKDEIKTEISDTFSYWLPFVQVQKLTVNMSETLNSVGKNKLIISIIFNIVKDPNTTESIQVEIGD